MNGHSTAPAPRPAPRPELFAAGPPYAVGFQHGSACADVIHRFLADDLARVNRLRPDPLSPARAYRIVARHAAWIERQLPALAEEIAGLAAGAGIRYEQAMLLQLRRELTRCQAERCDCTSIAYAAAGGGRLLGQTVDLTAGLGDLALVLHVRGAEPSAPSLCLLTFAGLCGYLGVNSHGLAVGINMVSAAGWRAGVPPYLLVRHLLGCRSIAEALDEIRRIHRASSRYLVLVQADDALGVEMTVDDLRTLRQPLLVHANHFLHPDLAAAETLAGDALAGSHRRRARMAALAAQGAPLEEILGDHEGYPESICAHPADHDRHAETVAAVVADPARRALRIAFGPPCRTEFHAYHA